MVPLERLAARLTQCYLKQFRVVAVIGARQVGKSTLVQSFADRHYVTLDDVGALAAARTDPRGFIQRLPRPLTLDEVQRAPELLLAVKEEVDRDRVPGAFLLTGSCRLETLRGIRESLAGRVAVVHLRPMTRLELAGHPHVQPLERLFSCEGVRSATAFYAGLNRKGNLPLGDADLLRGGFPEPALHLDDAQRPAWFAQYRTSYIERDVPAVVRIEDLPAFVRFVTACAATSARLVNYTDLARDVGVSVDTARRWTAAAEITFLADRRTPYGRNVRARLAKSPRLYLCDSGLMASLLGIRDRDHAIAANQAGPLLETWVHTQLSAAAGATEAPPEIHFFRTHTQAEVDFVLVRGHRIIAVEVKHAATVRPADARGIETLAALIPDAVAFGVVLYLGSAVVPLSEHAVAVPLGTLFAP